MKYDKALDKRRFPVVLAGFSALDVAARAEKAEITMTDADIDAFCERHKDRISKATQDFCEALLLRLLTEAAGNSPVDQVPSSLA